MKKSRILIVHNYYKIPGGEDTVVSNECSLLKENGHEVILYTRHNDEIDKRGALGRISLLFETIFSFKSYREIKRIIKEEKIDIVHVHNTLPLVSPSVYYAAFNSRVPVVQTIHNFRLLCPGATLTRNEQICEKCTTGGLKYSIKYKCYRNSHVQTAVLALMLKLHRIAGTYKRVDGYIALTEFNKKKLVNITGGGKKIFIKPNFAKKNKNIELPRKMENYFVFIGRLDKLKGVHLLLQAWRDIQGSRLLVIGDGPEKAPMEDFIKCNDLKNVELLGYMPREKAFEIIKKARAVILPSQCYEGFPMTIVESFSLGVPVIAGNIGNLESIVEHNKNGLHFKYNDKEELKQRIMQIMEDDKLSNKLNMGAFNTFIEKYEDKINYNILSEIYKKLTGDNIG